MHPPEVRAHALELVAAGYNDCQVSRMTGVNRRTICDWRRPTYVPQKPRTPRYTCPGCWRSAKPIRFTSADYTELLALYLGDGCLSRGLRTWRLRITLDNKYPGIIEDTRRLVRRIFPENSVDVVSRNDNCVAVSVYSQHVPCLFPQHGAGKKHERRIFVEPWQQAHLTTAPWGFIRGCIRSDGCCFVNRTDIHRPEPYEYVSYGFANRSKDIVDLFVGACDRVGVFTRANCNPDGRWDVRVNRRASVALMLEHVGYKS
jgi:hypothetical protein